MQNISRVLQKLVQALGHRQSLETLQKVDGGSYQTALLGSRTRDTMKDKNSRAYCVHTSLYTMQGLAFKVETDPPMSLV